MLSILIDVKSKYGSCSELLELAAINKIWFIIMINFRNNSRAEIILIFTVKNNSNHFES